MVRGYEEAQNNTSCISWKITKDDIEPETRKTIVANWLSWCRTIQGGNWDLGLTHPVMLKQHFSVTPTHNSSWVLDRRDGIRREDDNPDAWMWAGVDQTRFFILMYVERFTSVSWLTPVLLPNINLHNKIWYYVSYNNKGFVFVFGIKFKRNS